MIHQQQDGKQQQLWQETSRHLTGTVRLETPRRCWKVFSSCLCFTFLRLTVVYFCQHQFLPAEDVPIYFFLNLWVSSVLSAVTLLNSFKVLASACMWTAETRSGCCCFLFVYCGVSWKRKRPFLIANLFNSEDFLSSPRCSSVFFTPCVSHQRPHCNRFDAEAQTPS